MYMYWHYKQKIIYIKYHMLFIYSHYQPFPLNILHWKILDKLVGSEDFLLW